MKEDIFESITKDFSTGNWVRLLFCSGQSITQCAQSSTRTSLSLEIQDKLVRVLTARSTM